jgi:predicted glycoside hydrolase/deacetylase ChbG (UPF0249 family)
MVMTFKRNGGWIGLFLLSLAFLTSPVSAQRLAPGKYLIVHADDAGMSHSANVGTIAALESGLVRSASIMVPCPWFKEFAQYAKAHPEYDYGIHLTLNSEWDVYRWGPVADRSEVPSLVDPEGYLWDNVQQVMENAKADQVEKELRAQIDRAKAFGVPLSHLDTHMGAVMSRPDLVAVYLKLGIEYDLPVLFLRSLDEPTRKGYPALAARLESAIQMLDQKKLPVLDSLVQIYGGDDLEMRKAAYEEAIAKIPPGIHQLIIHCGYDDEELRAVTNSAARRNQDRQLFSSEEFKKLLQDHQIESITWRQFFDHARAP